MEAQVAQWIVMFSYPAVFLLLVLCGVGAPLSEELILFTGGMVASQGQASLPGMLLVGYLGILSGDSLLFCLGRRLGPRLLAHPWLARLLKPSRVELFRALLARRGALAVVVVRFLPGLRAPAYLLVGTSNMPYRRFLLADALPAAVSAGVLTWLGYRFGLAVLADVRLGLHWLLATLVLAAGLGLAVSAWRRRAGARRRLGERTPGQAPPAAPRLSGWEEPR